MSLTPFKFNRYIRLVDFISLSEAPKVSAHTQVSLDLAWRIGHFHVEVSMSFFDDDLDCS